MAHGCDFFDVDWSDKGIDHLVEVFRKKFIQMEKEKDEIIAQQADRIKQLELEVARLSGSLQSASDSSSDESSKGYNEDNTRSYNVRKFKGYPHVPSPARPRPSYEDSIEFPAYRKLAQISTCPTCGDPLAQTATTYERTSEDVKDGRWAVTCWDVERRYCKKCRRLQTAHCEGVVP